MIFPPECGQISLIPGSIVVKSSIISRIDFQASIISNQVHLTYIGQDKIFPAWDSCCLDITLNTSGDSKSGHVQFRPSGVGIVKTDPVYVTLPSAIISNVPRPKTINFEEDYKTYIGAYHSPNPHKKLTNRHYKKQKAKPVGKSVQHRRNGTHTKPPARNDSKKATKHKKKPQKRQHS
jgi:hypothetical protein